MKRRDFLKASSVATGAFFVGANNNDEDAVGKIPFKGAMYERGDGKLVLICRGLVYSVSHDEGRTWSKRKLLMNTGEAIQSDSDVLGLERLHSGKLALCYGRRQKVGNETHQEIFIRTSEDDGKTWSPENSLTPFARDDLYALHGSLVQLKSGRLILPSYSSYSHNYVGRPRGIGHTWLPEYYATHMLISDDEGVTWEPTGAMFLWKDFGHGGTTACGEACLAETADGRLLMLGRTTNMRALRSYSKDDGTTWSYVECSDLCSSNSPVRLKRIPSTGDLLVVWNQVTAQEHRDGYGRSRLSTAISKDSGQSWEHFRNLELCPGMDPNPRVVDPEPPQFVCAGADTDPGRVPSNRVRGIIRNSYPNVHFLGNKVFIDHDHHWKPNQWVDQSQRRDVYQKLHILPLDALYV